MSSQDELISLRLYMANGTPNSVMAIRNLQAIIEECLAGRHCLEIVDVFKEPSRAIAEGVLVTPTLVKLSPPPKVSVVGNLSDAEKVLYALDLEKCVK
jgi:circadian clock protein KaiB